jgi:hypothetical protein
MTEILPCRSGATRARAECVRACPVPWSVLQLVQHNILNAWQGLCKVPCMLPTKIHSVIKIAVLLVTLLIAPANLSKAASTSTIPLGSPETNAAWVYLAGTQFHNGGFNGTIPVGNINTVPTRVRSFIKFNISQFHGKALSRAVLTLPRHPSHDIVPSGIHEIGIELLEYDAGAESFSNSPALINRSTIPAAIIHAKSSQSSYSIDVTTALQLAIDRGYHYATFRLNDLTSDTNNTYPSYVFFDVTPSLTATEADPILLGDPALNVAWDYWSGGQFHNGLLYGFIPVGNINSVPTRVRAFLKFDLSAYAGRSLSSASLELPKIPGENLHPNGTHEIAVKLVDANFGSGPFTNSPSLVNRSAVTGTTFAATFSGSTFSINVKTLAQTALDRGYQFITFRLNDVTTDASAVSPGYVFFSHPPKLRLAEAPISLVENGVSRVSIHTVSSTVSLVEQEAAEQLQQAFATATGATPAINPGTPAAIQIKLGIESAFAQGIGDTHPHSYSYRRSSTGNIEILGKTPPAVLWGVNGFCRDILKVTWPIADEQIALKGEPAPIFTVNALQKTSAPAFFYRGWIISENTHGQGFDLPICNWMARTRQNSILHSPSLLYDQKVNKSRRGLTPDTVTHSFAWLIPASEYKTSHPEYFPLIGGARKTVPDLANPYLQLCISNPAVLQIVTNKALQAFAENPELNVFGVAQNDGNEGWCQCANCLVWDLDQMGQKKYSNRLIRFVNSVADGIATAYPAKKIGTLAYGETWQPPSINTRPNVEIMFTTGGRNYMKKLTDSSNPANAEIMQSLNGWRSRAQHIRFWEYYFYTGLERCPVPWSRTLCAELPELAALQIKGIFGQIFPSQWKGMSLFSYTFSRLMWDSSLTYDAILTDFCAERYGPAATEMKAYHRLYEDIVYQKVPYFPGDSAGEQILGNAFTNAEIAQLDALLTAASNKANSVGSSANAAQVQKELALFNSFKELRVDPAVPGMGPNLVSNPSIVSGSNSWLKDTRFPFVPYTMSISNTGRTDSKSLSISGTSPGWARWHQSIPGITNGNKYALRVWVKATAGVRGDIWLTNGTQSVILNLMDSNGQWQQVVCPEFSVTSSGLWKLHLEHRGTGTILFDDLYIAKHPQ